MRSTTTLSKINTRLVLYSHIAQLKKTNIVNPEQEAMILLQHALRMSKLQFLALDFTNHQLTAVQLQRFSYYIKQRSAWCPLSYIVGTRSFWNHDFVINNHTLDPRPETEGVVKLGLALLPSSTCHILDLGTGSGCILLSLLSMRQSWSGLGIDFRKGALRVARYNAQKLKLSNRAKFQYGNWYKTPVMHNQTQYHLCTCNAPYISTQNFKTLDHNVRYYEPREALHGGDGGLLSYRYILKNINYYLLPRGLIIMEHNHEQYEIILKLIRLYGLNHHSSHLDYSHKMRITVAQKI